MSNPLEKISLTNIWHFLATGFGSGLAPFAPGTFGTLAAIPFYLLLVQLPFSAYVILVILSCFVGIKICQVTSDDMGVHDHGSIVWDEFAGLWITLGVIPAMNSNPYEWKWIIGGFLLFRLFDIIKPWPIGWVDKRVHGGFGIMADDILAGIMGAVVLWGIIRFV